MLRALAVKVADVSPRLGWRPPTPAQRAALQAALEDAHDDVEAYLGQPITPTETTERGLFPYLDTWQLTNDPIEVTGVVAQTAGGIATGLFDVTYTWGLDAATNPELRPILRYVTAAALAHPLVVAEWQAGQGLGARRTRSVSAEGQSVTFDYVTPAGVEAGGMAAAVPGAVGAVPPLSSLDRWRVAGRRVYQRPGTYYGGEVRTTGRGYVMGWWEAPT